MTKLLAYLLVRTPLRRWLLKRVLLSGKRWPG